MKVAVTGASGFIGRHVLEELTRRGVETVAMVRAVPAEGAPLDCDRVVSMDIHAPPADAYQRLGSPDVLIHLAWGGLPHYRALSHFDRELPGQYRFLGGLVASGLANMVVAGTCLEYGMQSGCLAEDLPTRPHTPYGLAKDVLRRQLQFLAREQAFNLTWARLFYLYGPGQPGTSLYAQITAAAARGDRRFDMSGGEQLRDYLPVATVARHLVDVALARRSLGVVNLCSGAPISVRRLVEGWVRENRWPMELNLGRYPYPDYEPMAFWGDPTKLSRLIEEGAPS